MKMKLVVEGERRMSGRGLKRERRLFVVTMGQFLDAVGFGEILPRCHLVFSRSRPRSP